MRSLVHLVILLGFVLGAGCQANSVEAGVPVEVTASPNAGSSSTSVTVLPTQGGIQMTPSLSTPTDSGLQSVIGKAKADLVQRLSISANEITLVEASEAEWPNSGLGCPQPGMDYLQVITPGYLILLEANAQIHEYHSNRDAYVVYCETPDSPVLPKP